MRKWTLLWLTVLLFLTLATPAWADDGEGQLILPGGSIVIGPDEDLQGDLTVIGGSAEVRQGGRVDGDMVVLGGNAVVDGYVEDNLVVIGGTLELQSHAVVADSLFTFGASVTRAEGAVVRGETIEGLTGRVPALRVWPRAPTAWPFSRTWTWRGEFLADAVGGFMRWLLNTLALMALGVVVVLILPKHTALVGQTVGDAPAISFGVGLLTFLALLVLVPLLVVICVGIPVAVLLVLAAVAAGIFGWIATGALLGQRLLAAARLGEARRLVEAVVGLAVIGLLSSVPCLGWVAWILVAAAGIGAVVLTRFGTMPYATTPRLAGPPDLGAPPKLEGEDQPRVEGPASEEASLPEKSGGAPET